MALKILGMLRRKRTGAQDQRSYQRFAAHVQRLVTVDGFGEERLGVADVSFGGLGVVPRGKATDEARATKEASVSLRLLDQQFTCPVKVARIHGGVIGLQFLRRNIEALYAIHNFLEALRIGQSLEEAEADEGRRLEAGESCQLDLKEGDGASLDSLRLVFKIEQGHWAFKVEGRLIVQAERHTPSTAASPNPGIQMKRLERRVLRDVVGIIAGIQDEDLRRRLQPALELCLAGLGLETPAAA